MSAANQLDETQPQGITVVGADGVPRLVAPGQLSPAYLQTLQPDEGAPMTGQQLAPQAPAADPNAVAGQQAWLDQMGKTAPPPPQGQVEDVTLPDAQTYAKAAQETAYKKKEAVEGVPAMLARPPEVASSMEPAAEAKPEAPKSGDYVAQYERESEKRLSAMERMNARAAEASSKAIDLQAAVAQKEAAAKSQLLQQGMTEQARLEAQQAENQAFRKQAQDQAKGVMDRHIKEQAEFAFDPDRFSKNLGVGGSIGMAIAVGLGQMGAVLGHTSNTALTIMQDAIHRDAEAQKEAYQRGERAIGNARNAYQDLIQQGLSEKEADQALRAGKWAAVQRQIDVTAAAYGGQEAEARAAGLRAQVQQQQAGAYGAVMEHRDARALRIVQMKMERDSHQATLDAKMHARPQGSIPGLVGQATSVLAHNEATAIETGYQQAMPIIAQLKELRQKYGPESMPSEAAAVAASLATQLQLKLKESFRLGVMSKDDHDMLAKIVPDDPTSIKWVMARLDTLEQTLGRDTAAGLRVRGFSGRDPQFEPRYEGDIKQREAPGGQ